MKDAKPTLEALLEDLRAKRYARNEKISAGYLAQVTETLSSENGNEPQVAPELALTLKLIGGEILADLDKDLNRLTSHYTSLVAEVRDDEKRAHTTPYLLGKANFRIEQMHSWANALRGYVHRYNLISRYDRRGVGIKLKGIIKYMQETLPAQKAEPTTEEAREEAPEKPKRSYGLSFALAAMLLTTYFIAKPEHAKEVKDFAIYSFEKTCEFTVDAYDYVNTLIQSQTKSNQVSSPVYPIKKSIPPKTAPPNYKPVKSANALLELPNLPEKRP